MITDKKMLRRMGEFEVTQRTKDSFFSATKLVKQWNSANGDNIDLSNFWKGENLKEVMYEIALGEGLIDKDFTSVDSTYLKNILSTSSKASKGASAGTWMHPYLFMKCAMYISPKFEYQVLKFVSDQLIDFRHEAGDNYRELSSAVQQFKGIDYRHMARALNYIVFNTHKKELRQTATEKQLDDLRKIQKHYAFAVNTGLIKSWADLLEHMRTMWAVKWNGGI